MCGLRQKKDTATTTFPDTTTSTTTTITGAATSIDDSPCIILFQQEIKLFRILRRAKKYKTVGSILIIVLFGEIFKLLLTISCSLFHVHCYHVVIPTYSVQLCSYGVHLIVSFKWQIFNSLELVNDYCFHVLYMDFTTIECCWSLLRHH